MRCAIFAIFVLRSFAIVALGKLSPLTVKDVSLMLRSGYSVEAIQQDLAARHFLGVIDEAGEKELTQSGATAALLAKMKSDVYAVPAADVSAVKREMEAKAQSRAASTEEAQKANQLYQAKVARSRAETPTPAAAGNRLASMIKGDLVTSRNGTLQTYNDQALDGKKLLGLYFSAKWCPTCRKFTPQLVEYYNRVVAKHPEFEIIFVSNDRSAPAMESYMRDAQMPWPAVKFEKIADKQVLTRYAGSGIPCLVIVDAQGRIVSDSYDGKTYRGPEKVLADLDQFFARGSAPEVAQGR